MGFYNVLQARAWFTDGKLKRVTVLVEMSANDVRAITAIDEPRNGYTFLPPSSVLNEQLLQRVAAYGMETTDRDKLFPNWRENYKPA